MDRTDDRTIDSLLSAMREILRSPGYASPEQRKAAFRRVLHDSSVGMTQDQAGRLLSEIESRFPDRIYESSSRASALEKHARDLEEEAARLRKDLEKANSRARALDQLVDTVVQAATRAAGDSAAASEASTRLMRDPAAMRPLFEVLAQTLEYVVDQEAVVREFEAPMERAPARPDQGTTLRQMLAHILRDERAAAGSMEALQRRLKRLRRFPAALISGSQQSWRSGTTAVLKALDPAAAKPGKPKWHKPGAALDDTRDRFKSFWDQLDLNIDHYYRATFERIYAEAMEERR